MSVNNAPVTLLNNSFSLNVPLTNEGINLVTVAARDSAGNDSSVTSSIIRDTISPALSLLSPTEGEITNTLRVQGTVSDSSPVSIEVGDFVLPVEAGGVFRSEVQIIEGAQQVTLIARDAAGNQSLLSRSVTIDRTLPVITEISPTDGATVGSSQVVSGRITDATLTIVKVNGVTANLNANGTFSSNVVSLNEGENQIVITAVDAATNEARVAFVLNGRDRTPPATPSLFPVISPTRLAFQTIEGRAEPGSVVTIAGGLNNVTAEAAIGTGLFVAHINLRAGSNLLVISATDVEGNTSPATQVAITSNPSISLPPPGSPAHINISTGNTQKGLVSFELPRPLIAIVTDQEGNPVAGVNVKFTLQTGAGAFVNGGNFIDVVTDTQGYASVRYLAGETPGLQQVRADFAGNLLTPAVFLTEILTAQPNTATTLSGIVLDQNLRALPNVLARIGGQQTVTGNDGRFTLRNVASGPHQLLELIGRNQIPLPGRWPNLTYDIDILPGVDNQLGRPFFLPKVNEGIALPLNQDNVVTRDTTYELPVREGESPIKVTAKTGTRIIFPPDVTDRRFSVTKISTNRVPMPLEDGRATSLYISVQPSGAIFETPLEVSFPNLDRLSAGSEVMLMSFDHDAGRYIQVGQGHVSSDGRVIKSDPGSGIRLGAWHALPPEPPEPEVSVLGHIQISGNPLLEGKDILETDAWVEGTRAVQISGAGGPGGTNQLITAATNSGSNAVTRLNYRATFSVPRNSPPRAYSMEARTIAQTPTLELSTRTVFIGLEKTKEVTASLTSAPSGTPKFSWSTDNDDIATVEFAAGNTAQSSPNRVIIRGGTKAGTTKIKVKYESSTNGKAQAEVQVNVVKVEFESSTGANPDCNGFDNTIVGTAPNIEPFWLTVILGGTFDLPTAGTTSQVRAKVTPSTAANMVSFAFPQADQFVAVAPLMATTSPQLLTVTSRATASGAGQNGSTFLSANLDGVEIAQLGVVVRRRLQIPLNFHFMSDNAGRPHRTNRATNMAGANTVANNYLQAVNAIIRNQVGVEFTLATVAFNQVQQNLTDVVSDIDLNAISAFGGQGLGQDVYFVWELENGEQIPTGGPGVVVYRVTASNRGTHNYVDDSATFSDAAHEHAHSLIANPRDPYVAPDGTIDARHSNPLRDLLFPHSNGRGCLIQKRDVDPLGL